MNSCSGELHDEYGDGRIDQALDGSAYGGAGSRHRLGQDDPGVGQVSDPAARVLVIRD